MGTKVFGKRGLKPRTVRKHLFTQGGRKHDQVKCQARSWDWLDDRLLEVRGASMEVYTSMA